MVSRFLFPPPPVVDLDADEGAPPRDELARLRAEVAQLRRERDAWLEMLMSKHPEMSTKEKTTP